MAEDLELWRAWRDGDAACGDELVRRYFVSIHRFFRSKVPAHVDELTQRTFLACVEARERSAEVVGFRGYLYGIARKQLLKHLSRITPGQVVDLSSVSVHDLRTSPSRAVGRREEHEALLVAIQHLPVDAQIVLELYYWEDMPLAEIATVLEDTYSAVKTRLHRARVQLRDALGRIETAGALVDLDARTRDLGQVLGPDDE